MSVEGTPNLHQSLFKPLYESAEAARIVGLSPGRVRRWLFGYHYQRDGALKNQAPVVKRGPEESLPLASFLDLIELLSVGAFLEHGFSLQRVRKACEEASQVLNIDHPFARQRFFTNGKDVFMSIEGRRGVENLKQLLSGGQWVIAPIVLRFAKEIEFDQRTSLARRWWPLGTSHSVIVDPDFALGAPSIANRGLKTAAVFDFFNAESKNEHKTADWFGIGLEQVRDAVAFERKQLGLAA